MRAFLFLGTDSRRTAVASSFASLCAKEYKTVIISTGSLPHNLPPRLHAVEINYSLLAEELKDWRGILGYTEKLYKREMELSLAKEMLHLGLRELSGWVKVSECEDEFDVCIYDAPLSDQILGLVAITSATDWYMRKYFKRVRRLVRVARGFAQVPIFSWLFSIPTPPDQFFAGLETLHKKIRRTKEIITEGSARILIGEKSEVKEARKAVTFLSLFGIRTDQIISFTRDGEVRDSFSPIPISYLEDSSSTAIAKIYKKDPARILFRDRVMDVRTERNVLEVALGYKPRGKPKIRREGDELIVKIGRQTKILHIPYIFISSVPSGCEVKGKKLLIKFEISHPLR